MSQEMSANLENTATGSDHGDSLHPDNSNLLYNIKRLTDLSKWNQIQDTLSELNLVARPLAKNDFNKGYLELLRQLTQVGNVSREDFERQFNRMRKINSIDEHYFVVVFEDIETKRVIACSTLVLELKFIHECANRARLEDVAVLDSYRGKKIGQIIVSLIVELASEGLNCYKLSLDCTDELKKFYQLNNFTYNSNMMCIRFH